MTRCERNIFPLGTCRGRDVAGGGTTLRARGCSSRRSRSAWRDSTHPETRDLGRDSTRDKIAQSWVIAVVHASEKARETGSLAALGSPITGSRSRGRDETARDREDPRKKILAAARPREPRDRDRDDDIGTRLRTILDVVRLSTAWSEIYVHQQWRTPSERTGYPPCTRTSPLMSGESAAVRRRCSPSPRRPIGARRDARTRSPVPLPPWEILNSRSAHLWTFVLSRSSV